MDANIRLTNYNIFLKLLNSACSNLLNFEIFYVLVFLYFMFLDNYITHYIFTIVICQYNKFIQYVEEPSEGERFILIDNSKQS
jgi:hypothetical protein